MRAPDQVASREGARRAALHALLWTAAIAVAKLIVGALTGSVAVLGDGLHSAFDVIIAGVTLFAVRLAAKPPDATHPYGHGRAENLAALAEAIVMALVGTGIAVEAARRVIVDARVDVPPYALIVTAAALAIGAWRSRSLQRAARRYSSPALEADAANMRADVLESLAVLAGLALTRVGFAAGDPAAAFVVVVLMCGMAARIGWRAVNVLMDRAPLDLSDRVATAASAVAGVLEVGDLRVRQSGPDVHAEVTVSVGRTSSVEQSHEITEAVEEAVARAVPGATATVHVEPSREGEDLVVRTFAAANRLGMADQVHNVLAIRHPEGLWLMLHAKVPPQTALGDAHHVSDSLEAELRREIDGLARVEIHLEPHEPASSRGIVVTTHHADLVRGITRIVESHPPLLRCHEVALTETSEGLVAVLHVEAPYSTSIAEIHDASLAVEADIHRRYRDVRTVLVHFEPASVEDA
jgi:cation diffusion facilitator family transporter